VTEAEQARREDIADQLCDREDYFNMDDPSDFLDWAVENAPNFVNLDNEGYAYTDYDGLLDTWVLKQMRAA
jgi:hypothetical protein